MTVLIALCDYYVGETVDEPVWSATGTAAVNLLVMTELCSLREILLEEVVEVVLFGHVASGAFNIRVEIVVASSTVWYITTSYDVD